MKIKLVLISSFLMFALNTKAQKLSTVSLTAEIHTEYGSSVRLSFEKPNELFFYGFGINYFVSVKEKKKSVEGTIPYPGFTYPEDYDDKAPKYDLNLLIGIGLNNIFNLPLEIQPYVAARPSFSGLAIEGGASYMLTKRFGLKGQIGQTVRSWQFLESAFIPYKGFYFGTGISFK
ncbi:hypothetical protein [Pseudomonas shirazensis]